jgi:hypothetical protein
MTMTKKEITPDVLAERNARRLARQKAYNASPQGKEVMSAYKKSGKSKATRDAWRAKHEEKIPYERKPKRKAKREKTEKEKEYNKKYDKSPQRVAYENSEERKAAKALYVRMKYWGVSDPADLPPKKGEKSSDPS